ncbi:hypothetical protein GQ600_14001 [Phytophthora cactorum]|nr:hypothetical protein GQ600_14001 [Phytophthora cactorum]
MSIAQVPTRLASPPQNQLPSVFPCNSTEELYQGLYIKLKWPAATRTPTITVGAGVERLAEAAIPHDRRQVELHGEVGGHGVATKHCWHIPVDGSERMAC